MNGQKPRQYDSPFKRHLAFFDRDNDGHIFFGDSLRGNLALGFDFPVAMILATGYQITYGNVRPFFFGPLRGIEISRAHDERNMLEAIDVADLPDEGLDRKTLVAFSGSRNFLDKMHVNGLWAVAANRQGMLPARDIPKIQDGTILYELEQRRKGRSDILPLLRGGPISVTGHSWFVDKLFGVKVYQKDISQQRK